MIDEAMLEDDKSEVVFKNLKDTIYSENRINIQ
jgi:hypothetical protein